MSKQRVQTRHTRPWMQRVPMPMLVRSAAAYAAAVVSPGCLAMYSASAHMLAPMSAISREMAVPIPIVRIATTYAVNNPSTGASTGTPALPAADIRARAPVALEGSEKAFSLIPLRPTPNQRKEGGMEEGFMQQGGAAASAPAASLESAAAGSVPGVEPVDASAWDADVEGACGVSFVGLDGKFAAYEINEPPVGPLFRVHVRFPVEQLLHQGCVRGAAQRAVVWFHGMRMSRLFGEKLTVQSSAELPRWWMVAASGSADIGRGLQQSFECSFAVHFPDPASRSFDKGQYAKRLQSVKAQRDTSPLMRAKVVPEQSKVFMAFFNRQNDDSAIRAEGQRVAQEAAASQHAAMASSRTTASSTALASAGNAATQNGGAAGGSHARSHGFAGYNVPALTLNRLRDLMAQHVEVVLAFPRLRAIVLQGGRARAVAARCSRAEQAARLSVSGLARPVVPVHEDGFRNKCASVTARISDGALQLTALEPEQARQWCCGSQVFNEELSLDGCCRMLVARAVLTIKGQRLSPPAGERFRQVAAVLKSATLHAALPEWPDRMELVASVLAQPHAPLPVCLEPELCSGEFVLVQGESSFLSDILQLPEAQGESVRARCVVEMLSGFALNGQSEAFVQLLLRAGASREGLEEAGVCVLRVTRGGSEERQQVKIPHTDGSEWVHAKMLRSQAAAQEQQDAHEAWLAVCTCLLEAYGVGDQSRTAGHRKASFTVDTGRTGVARVLGATEQASTAWEARQVIEARLTEIGIRAPSMNLKGEFILRLPLRTEWTPDEHQKPSLDAACQHALNFRSMGPEIASAAGGFIFSYVEILQLLFDNAVVKRTLHASVLEAKNALGLCQQLHAAGCNDGGRGGGANLWSQMVGTGNVPGSNPVFASSKTVYFENAIKLWAKGVIMMHACCRARALTCKRSVLCPQHSCWSIANARACVARSSDFVL